MTRTFRKGNGNRIGVELIEWIDGHERTVAKWGPYLTSSDLAKAMKDAEAMREKLMRLWPCTFLAKDYKYQCPCSSTDIEE